MLFIDAVIDPIEELSRMVKAAREYFRTYSEKQRSVVKDIIKSLRRHERKADRHEAAIKERVMNMKTVERLSSNKRDGQRLHCGLIAFWLF